MTTKGTSMREIFSKLYGPGDAERLRESLKVLVDAVEDFRREDQHPVPCHIMRKSTKEALFAKAEALRSQVYCEEFTRKVK